MFMVGYPRTRGIGYTRMFLHKRPNNSLMNRPGKPGAVQEDFAMKKTNDTLLTNDPDCVRSPRRGSRSRQHRGAAGWRRRSVVQSAELAV